MSSSDYKELCRQYQSTLKTLISDSRYAHSLRVADTAVGIGLYHNLPNWKTYVAGLLHDSAKDLSPDTLLEDYDIVLTPREKRLYLEYPSVWHALISPKVMFYLFDVFDRSVLSASRWHCTGKAKMTTLEKVIYVADYLEPERDIPSRRILENLAKANLDKAVFMICSEVLKKLISENKPLFPSGISCYNFYLYARV